MPATGENLPRFRALQLDLASYVRDPQHAPAPEGIEPRRLQLYANLIHDNVRGFLDRTFPVARAMVGEDAWSALGRAFLRDHRASTPYFTEIPLELQAFLGSESAAALQLPDWLPALCHYEWLELELDIAPDELTTECAAIDPMTSTLVQSPLIRAVSYPWPVHRIREGAEVPARGEQPVHLVVYRDRADAVNFVELNALAARLLALFEVPMTGCAVVDVIAADLGRPPETLVDAVGAQLSEWLDRPLLIAATC